LYYGYIEHYCLTYLATIIVTERSKLMAAKGSNEVKDSVRELVRIYKPANPRKFVKDYVKKYRIPGGYEDVLTRLVEVEMSKMEGSVS
jgi:hypothetical protein